MQSNSFDKNCVSPQLKCSSVFAYQTLMTFGYPDRVQKQQFLDAYEQCKDSSDDLNESVYINAILTSIGFAKNDFKIGKQLIFFRNYNRNLVENLFEPVFVETNIEKFKTIGISLPEAIANVPDEIVNVPEETETEYNSTKPKSLKRIFTQSSDGSCTVEKRPCTSTRFDGQNHFPEIDDKENPSRCKLETCTLKSKIFCMKCNVHLCLKRNQNCFKLFHLKNKNHFLK